jgi:SAM-dependent methyltransferase
MLLKEVVEQQLKNNQPVRLHVGCGSRIFEGYLNVDGEYMREDPRVLIHDITTTFPIADNTVDEILSVHVLEHITRGRVKVMLEEWLRILKPGGFVAIEWPDFYKMCKEVVDHPECLSIFADRRLQKRSILGIYGDNERYPDPVMWHKWGYSEASMQELLIHCGYTRTQSQQNLHSKTSNDSRVVGFK